MVLRLPCFGINVTDAPEGKHSALTAASKHGELNIVQHLLAAGASANVQTESQCTPLLYAATHGFNGIVKELLAYDADATIKCPLGKTPLFAASESGRYDVTQTLCANSQIAQTVNEPRSTQRQRVGEAGAAAAGVSR